MIATKEQQHEFITLLTGHCDPKWIDPDITHGVYRELHINTTNANYDKLSTITIEFNGSPSRNCIFIHLSSIIIINGHRLKSYDKISTFVLMLFSFLKKHKFIPEHTTFVY